MPRPESFVSAFGLAELIGFGRLNPRGFRYAAP
jgi:hypothetical protein